MGFLGFVNLKTCFLQNFLRFFWVFCEETNELVGFGGISLVLGRHLELGTLCFWWWDLHFPKGPKWLKHVECFCTFSGGVEGPGEYPEQPALFSRIYRAKTGIKRPLQSLLKKTF